ncbi:MAG: hypothetical protein QOK26_2216 [Pseudonocardiales bacterium]|nr:hypothetical protein [Pseudonocardiales bacterium]
MAAAASDTYPALVRAAAAEMPDRVFLHCASELTERDTVTFGELELRSRRVAAGLLARGLGPGDRIAVAAANQAEWLELFLGAARIGVVVVTLNVRYRAAELEYMLNQARVRLVVTAAKAGEVDLEAFYPGFLPAVPTVEHVLFLGGTGAGEPYLALPVDPVTTAEHADLDRRADAVLPGDPAVILYTSGTTGTPKGAVLTHASLLGSARAQAARLGTGADDVVVSALPLNHVGGLTCTVTSAFVGRSTVVLARAFSPATALRDIAEHRATVVAGVPTMWTLILGHGSFAERDTSSVRVAVVGGANADPALCAAIGSGFPGARLYNLYGLSEVSGACVMSGADDDLDTVARTLGTPLDGVRTRVVDADGADVAPGGEGELRSVGREPPPATGACRRPVRRCSCRAVGWPPATS